MNSDLIAIATRFRFDSLLIVPLQNQETTLRTCLLQRCSHERVDQSLQDDLARHGLRDFENGGEIQLFDRCPNRARRTGRWPFLPEVRIELVELPYFTRGSPTQITM